MNRPGKKNYKYFKLMEYLTIIPLVKMSHIVIRQPLTRIIFWANTFRFVASVSAFNRARIKLKVVFVFIGKPRFNKVCIVP